MGKHHKNNLYFVSGVTRQDRAVIIAPDVTALNRICPFPIKEMQIVDQDAEDYGILLASTGDCGYIEIHTADEYRYAASVEAEDI